MYWLLKAIVLFNVIPSAVLHSFASFISCFLRFVRRSLAFTRLLQRHARDWNENAMDLIEWKRHEDDVWESGFGRERARWYKELFEAAQLEFIISLISTRKQFTSPFRTMKKKNQKIIHSALVIHYSNVCNNLVSALATNLSSFLSVVDCSASSVVVVEKVKFNSFMFRSSFSSSRCLWFLVNRSSFAAKFSFINEILPFLIPFLFFQRHTTHGEKKEWYVLSHRIDESLLKCLF